MSNININESILTDIARDQNNITINITINISIQHHPPGALSAIFNAAYTYAATLIRKLIRYGIWQRHFTHY
jgi:hypothetical protein